MSQTNQQQAYLRAYDRYAARLYRFALYVSGDAGQAEAAVTEAFGEGLRRSISPAQEDRFLEEMLALVWHACARFEQLEGPAYREHLRRAAPGTIPAALAERLSAMPRFRRAALALAALFGFDAAALRRILPACQPGRIAAAVVSLLRSSA